MTTELLEQVINQGTNGDHYWEREFNHKEHGKRIYRSEGRGIVAHVETGVELGWARTFVGHDAWYPFLKKDCKITPDTAQRRIRLAIEFIEWAGIPRPLSRYDRTPWIQALELIHGKTCNLQDFADYKRTKLNPDDFLPVKEREYRENFEKCFFDENHDPAKTAKWLQVEWWAMTNSEKTNVVDALNLTIDIYRGLLATFTGRWEKDASLEIRYAEEYLEKKQKEWERLWNSFHGKGKTRADFVADEE